MPIHKNVSYTNKFMMLKIMEQFSITQNCLWISAAYRLSDGNDILQELNCVPYPNLEFWW